MSDQNGIYVGSIFSCSNTASIFDLFADQNHCWQHLNLRANADGSRVLVEILDPKVHFEIDQNKMIEFYELKSGERFRLAQKDYVYVQKYAAAALNMNVCKKPQRQNSTKWQWMLCVGAVVVNFFLIILITVFRAR